MIVSAFGGASAQTGAQDVVGVWIDHTSQGAVEISRCGASICGRIFWMQKPTEANGKPVADVNNKDVALRATPLCGLQIIGETKASPQGWASGWIYNPDDGTKYSVDVRRLSPDRLEVHGYLGFRALGESFIWKRAPDTLARCAVK